MASAEIIGTEKVFSSQSGRQGKVDRIVLYRAEADPARTLWVMVPDEGFTLEAAQAAIRKAETDRRLSQPVKFTL